jgi:hypothetical protein
MIACSWLLEKINGIEKETCLIKEAKEKNKANQVNALASGT